MARYIGDIKSLTEKQNTFLIHMWKRESRIAVIECKNFRYFPNTIPQHVSIVLAYLWIVFTRMFNLKSYLVCLFEHPKT